MNTHKKNSESGQVLLLLAVGLVVLLAFVALAIDGGAIFLDRRSAQNAADAAALAGAYQLARNPWDTSTLPTRIDNESNARAHDNHYGNADGKSVCVYYPPTSPSTDADCPPPVSVINYVAGDTDVHHYVRVTISSTVFTSFLHFVFNGPVVNTVQAVAHVIPPTFRNPFDGSGMVSLKPSGRDGIKVGGNLEANLIGGGMFINTNSSTLALTGGSQSTFLYTPSLTTVGGYDTSSNSHLIPPNFIVDPGPIDSPDPSTAVPYPPQGFPSVPTCSTAAYSSGHVNLNGINYTHWYPGSRNGFPSGDVYFEPGIYCISINNGGMGNINNGQHIYGDGVLIVLTGNSPCNFTGNAQANLQLRGYGTPPYKGLLMYVDPKGFAAWTNSGSAAGTMIFNGDSNSYIVGTIYAPTCSLQLNGTGGNFYQGQLIGFDITLNGGAAINMLYVASDNVQIQTTSKVDLNQ